MKDDDDAWLGKGARAFRSWWRTFYLLLTDRRRLLSFTEAGEDGPLSPLAFLLATVAAGLVVTSTIGVQAPKPEQPPVLQLMVSATSSFWDPKTLWFVYIAAMQAAIFWAVFRLCRARVGFRVALRHSAYNLAGLVACAVLLNLADGLLRMAGVRITQRMEQASLLFSFAVYFWLLGIAFRQVADECHMRLRWTVAPFLIGLVLVRVVLAVSLDNNFTIWVHGVYGMGPAMLAGDAVEVNRWAAWGRPPKAGEVVLVRQSGNRPFLLVGGALADQARPLLGRVLGVPGDSVAMDGPDFVLNGERLPRERIANTRQPHSAGMQAWRTRLNERVLAVEYGPGLAPKPCLPPGGTVLGKAEFLLALDSRPDGAEICRVVPRGEILGFAEWNGRSELRP